MSNTKSLVLITTATNPPDGVFVLKMTNTAKRKVTAKAATLFWAASGVDKIVIADATGQTLLNDDEVSMLNLMNIEVEQINYHQDNNLIIKFGKGYGEGSLIKFAIENSKLLKNQNNFFKCTGKVFCRNYIEILNLINQNKLQNIFWKDIFDNKVDTRFFYVSKEFCINFIIPTYQNIDDRREMNSENLLLSLVSEKLTSATSVRPLLSGFAGGTDQPWFDKGMGYLDQNLLCWISQ